jgi:hypothetical protein
MSVWSHLPNAYHIDRVLKSVKSHPEIWDTAVDTAGDTALHASKVAAWNTACGAALDASRIAALDASKVAAWNTAWGTAKLATMDATAALIAYDDASKYLDIPSDKLRVLAILSETPAAVLLLPAVIAFERINELENAV